MKDPVPKHTEESKLGKTPDVSLWPIWARTPTCTWIRTQTHPSHTQTRCPASVSQVLRSNACTPVLGTPGSEPRASHVLSKCSTTELHFTCTFILFRQITYGLEQWLRVQTHINLHAHAHTQIHTELENSWGGIMTNALENSYPMIEIF